MDEKLMDRLDSLLKADYHQGWNDAIIAVGDVLTNWQNININTIEDMICAINELLIEKTK